MLLGPSNTSKRRTWWRKKAHEIRQTPGPFAGPDAPARKLVEIANGIEAKLNFAGIGNLVWAAEDINRAQQDSCDHEAADCVESANRHLLTLVLSQLFGPPSNSLR